MEKKSQHAHVSHEASTTNYVLREKTTGGNKRRSIGSTKELTTVYILSLFLD